jgi:hypothetical protein
MRVSIKALVCALCHCRKLLQAKRPADKSANRVNLYHAKNFSANTKSPFVCVVQNTHGKNFFTCMANYFFVI